MTRQAQLYIKEQRVFEHFIQSKIPVLGVHTDDVLNFQTALQLIAKRKVVPWPTLKTAQANLGPYLYWTDDLEVVTVEAVKKLKQNELQLVVINPEKPSDLVRDAGLLPYPESMIREYLEDFVQEAELPALLMVLRGLSLRVAEEITQITMARTGGLLPQELRRTRTLLSGSLQGLYTVDTELEFYQQPLEVGEWLKINSQYFMSPKTPQMLMPRGLMFSGSPGVGKSMASKAIAAHFGIPLFRLDISTTLNKYIGESEARVGRSLSMVEREGPCVLLLDEVEKIFSGNDDQGVTQRILSQLLWWLSEHRSKVLTVMTTNHLDNIPPELYRPGRIDRVVEIKRLTLTEAKLFASKVFKSVLAVDATMKQQNLIRQTIENLGKASLAHSEVAETVFELIKQRSWLPFDLD